MKKSLLFRSLALALTASVVFTSCSDDEDTIAPSITLSGNQTITVSLPSSAGGNGSWTDPGYSASDDEDGNITSQVSVSGTVDLNRKGTYVVTYTVSDKAGNSTSVQRTINVINDAEVFAGNYNNCVDSCIVTPPSAFNATVTTSDSINRLVKINNFGAFGSSVNIFATITGNTTGSSINITTTQSLGGTALLSNVYPAETVVVSGSGSTAFNVRYQWTDGVASDVCTSNYIR